MHRQPVERLLAFLLPMTFSCDHHTSIHAPQPEAPSSFSEIESTTIGNGRNFLPEKTPEFLDLCKRADESVRRYLADLPAHRCATEKAILGHHATNHEIRGYFAQNRALGDEARSIELYFAYKGTRPSEREAEIMFDFAHRDLLIAKQYAEILVVNPDPVARLNSQIRDYENSVGSEFLCGDSTAFMKTKAILDAQMVFEALVGVGRRNEALRLADLAIGFDPDFDCFSRFVCAAARAGDISSAEAIFALAKARLSAENLSALRTYFTPPRSPPWLCQDVQS